MLSKGPNNRQSLRSSELKKTSTSQLLIAPPASPAKRVDCHLSPLAPGQIIIISLIFLAAAAILSSTLFGRTAQFLRFGGNSLRNVQAQSLAEAGVDYAIWKLNKTAGAYSGDSQTLSVGSFAATVTTKSVSLKTITSTGFVPDSTSPRAKRTIKVDATINSASIAFRYAVQTGSGGVSMTNNTTINGTIYTNGNITGANSAQINGEAYAAGTISSPDPTILCATPPCAHPNASPIPLPDISSEVAQAKLAAEAGGTTTCPCTISNTFADIGPKKYVGNLTITTNAIVTVKGPVWVTGNLSTTQGGTQVNLDESFGSQGTYFIVDGNIVINQGATFNPTNSKGYILVVSNSTSSTALSMGQSGANAVFYALNGGAELTQTANVNSLTASQLSMQNSATLNYDSGLASAQFSYGPGGAWQLKKGTYRFTGSP